MKFHDTLIEKLIKTYEVYSGWRDQSKLRNALQEINLTVYTQQDGTEVLVDSSDLQKQVRDQQNSRD